MNRTEELNEIIRSANDELWRLKNKELLENNKKLIGKCFYGYEDVSRGYKIYIYAVKINEFDDLAGIYFKIYNEGNVEFSKPGDCVNIHKMIDLENYDEISYAEFSKKYMDILMLL